MLNIDATDKIEGIASVADKVEFTCSAVDGTTVKSSEGLLSNSQTQIYLATGATRILSLTLVNTHTSAVTVNVQKDPADAGTLYRIIPKDLSLGIGYMLVFDGQRCTVMDTNGNIITSLTANDSVYGAGWNGSKLPPTQDRVYDEMETKADKGTNADITSLAALTQITRATGGAFDIAIGGAAGDDFTVDTDKLVVEGDTGLVTIDGLFLLKNNKEIRFEDSGGNPRTVFELDENNDLWYGGSMAGSVIFVGGGSYTERIRIDDAGDIIVNNNLGVGTLALTNPLAVNRSGDGIIVDFESADVVEGSISIAGNTTTYGEFVGSHPVQLKLGQKELPIGAVVISTGEIIPCEANIPEITETKAEILEKNAFETVDIEIDLVIEKIVDGKLQKVKTKIGEEFKEYRIVDDKVVKTMKPIYEKTTIQKTQLKKDHKLDAKTGKIYKKTRIEQIISKNVSGKEYFTYIDITTKPADKAVYGVWLGKRSDDAKGMSFGQDSKSVYLIAQVGLFKVRVTDTNGNIEIGDFLETSSRSMEAQKQVSKQKESGTIAKAMINVEWSKVTVDSELGYKWKLIPAVF